MKSARYQFVAIMGTLMGLAGIEHGVGEILQGNVAPEGLMIRSWPHSAFLQSLNGEPAMTILPNLRFTGLLAVVFSLLFAGWAAFFVQRKHGGLVLMLLTVPMLLFGGGIFPPILGLLISAAAVRFRSQPVTEPVTGLRRFLGLAWRWIIAACCITWLALFPGVAVLDYFFGIDSVTVTLTMMVTALLFLFLAYWSSVQHDRLLHSYPANSIGNPIPEDARVNSISSKAG